MKNQRKQLHVGIIPDGNRRWAKQHSLAVWRGHQKGMKTARLLFDWACTHPRVSILTVWAFSTENWRRPSQEINKLMVIYEDFLRTELPKIKKDNSRFVHSGRLDRIPSTLRDAITTAIQQTADNDGLTINFALDYGGQDEIIRATQKALKDNQEISADSIRNYLDNPELPDIDLVIRSSGEQRTSGFFLWEAAYAEMLFLPQLFPDVTPVDLDNTIIEYDRRQRRFGA